MIGDNIKLNEEYLNLGYQIFNLIQPTLDVENVTVILIGGESGSGKSTLAYSLKEVLGKNQRPSLILHMDDYFFLPPETNHQARLKDISHVGPQEVNINLMEDHILKAKSRANSIAKPLVNYEQNDIGSEIINAEEISVIIAEGTYGMLIKEGQLRIFLTRNYKDTRQDRVARNRDSIVPFNEKVLEMEHKLIHNHKSLADIIVTKDFQAIQQKKATL